ncbi:MAG: ABC transporter ATP-binding protein [Bdellovibrionota bacterium]
MTSTSSPQPFKLLKTILFTRWQATFFTLFVSFSATATGLAAPFFQKLFVDHLTGYQGGLESGPLAFFSQQTPAFFIFLAFACFLLSALLTQWTNYLGWREAIIMQGVLAHKLYTKTLEMKSQDLRERPVGEIVSLYATDIPGATILLEQTLPTGSSTFFPLVLAPLFLGFIFKTNLTFTLSLMLVVAVLNSSLAFRQSKFFFKFKQLAAERIGLVSEWIQNIRGLRQLGWTRAFEERIFEKREVETINRVKMVTNGQIMNSVASSSTFIFNSVALTSFAYFSDRTLSPGEILTLLWVLGIFLTRPFRQMPWFFTFAFDGWTSIKRLEAFFSLPHTHTHIGKGLPDSTALKVKNLSLVYGPQAVLDKISFSIKKGELVGITGEVGSGKSLLFLSLIKETGASMEEFLINGKDVSDLKSNELRALINYVPQEPFIMNGSIRENLDLEYDTETSAPVHERALEMASFKLDQEKLDQGLEELIGERGVNLSGGQKQRLTLARASLKNAPLVLIDDGLSQLDIHTEAKVFSKLIEGEWKNHARLIVSHRMSLLKRMDRILYFENGKLVGDGTLEDLISNNPSFLEYLSKEEQNGKAKPGIEVIPG